MRNNHERYAKETYKYGTGVWTKAADPEKCRWEVWDGFSSNQCSRKAKVDGLWCGIHNPDYMDRKDQARRDKYSAEIKRRELKDRHYAWRNRARAIIQMIAYGEANNPAELARMYLEEEPK